MMVVLSAENRPLKRQKLGPPDVYPQDPKQKEDELDDVSVKQGFIHRPQIQDEYGSALSTTLNASKVADCFNLILKKKAEINQLPDTGRKKQQINIKDNFWLVTPRTPRSKTAVEAWFKDLAGSKPLTSLAKKVPIFPKREDMLLTLCEYTVPLQRAIWFIKMTFFYHESKVAESKIKKRQQPDLSQDMTVTLTRFLREQLGKIVEAYGVPGSQGNTTPGSSTPGAISHPPGSTPPGSTTPGSSTPSMPPHSSPHHGISGSTGTTTGVQLSHNLRYWHYTVQLTLFMYQDGLLDRQDLLDWIVESITRYRTPEQDNALRVVLPLGLQYLDEITQSEYLSRKLSYFSAVKLSQMCLENGYNPPPQASTASSSSVSCANGTSSTPAAVASSATVTPNSSANNGPAVNNTTSETTQGYSGASGASDMNPNLASCFQELLACNQHRPIVLALSAFIQAATLDCSTALVWNNGGEKRNSWLCESPLDQLPCPPSQLPMPQRHNNPQIRADLRSMEDHLKQRSRAARNRWSLDKYGVNITGWTTNRVLEALDALDRHSFDCVDAINSLDTLYNKIFANKDGMGENGAGTISGQPCSNSFMPPNLVNNGSLVGGTWPETGDGWEDAVVTTICEWAVTVQRCGEHRAVVAARLLDKRQSYLLAQAEAAGNAGSSVPYYTFQNLLLKFLDSQAPVYDECKTSERSREFGNLVLLFSELIRYDVFSHDGYMCTLISRGDLADPPAQLNPSTTAATSNNFGDVKEESNPLDNIDEDLGKILQNITKDAGDGSHESPPQHELSSTSVGALDDAVSGSRSAGSAGADSDRKQPSRHLIYAQHFPLPSDDSYSHEINQRYVLLYGVGKARDEARHAVKKLTKEILKLFSKRFSNDIAEGGKVKKSSKGEFSFENILSRFSQLSYFDQHVITNTVAAQVVEMLCGCSSGTSNYLPTLDHIAFLMDLMETGLNIHGLLQLCCQLIKEIVEIESVLSERQCLIGTYCPQLTLLVLGVLRKYNKCLLVSQDQSALVFEGLLRLVKNVSGPSECSSADRIVFAYLNTLYTSCSFIKMKHQESFAGTASRIRQALCGSHAPSDGKHRRNPHIMEEYINNPKQRIDLISVKQLLSEPNNRYSFACSAVMAAVDAPTNTRLNDIAVLCAEITACCNTLSSDWLGILNVLCSSVSNAGSGGGSSSGGGSTASGGGGGGQYSEVVAAIDLRDPLTASAAHASLSVFTAILIARDCFTFEELLNRVVVHSLKAAWNNGKGNPEVEPGARLSCHLLLRIFQNVDSSRPAQYCPGSPSSTGGASSGPQRSVRLSCDRHLLVAAHLSFSMEPVLAFLKAVLIVSDAMSGQCKNQSSSISDILGTSYIGAGTDADVIGCGVDKVPLADFARYALRQICCQDWVREICLKHPEKLCNSDNLLDSILTPSQAQRVLHNICHPESGTSTTIGSGGSSVPPVDQRTAITNILKDLDEWRLRISWLELHLMYEQLRTSTTELNQWLDNVAQSAIQVFCQAEGTSSSSSGCSKGTANDKARRKKLHSMNLIAPLISKLPRQVQGRVLKVSGQVLNAVNFGAYSSHKAPVVPQPGAMPGSTGVHSAASLGNNTSVALGGQSATASLGLGCLGGTGIGNAISGGLGSTTNYAQIPVHSQRAFLQLMLMCLEAAQDDHLSDLLECLRMQLMQPVTLYKELGRNRGEVEPNKRKLMLEALRLRFGLIGGLFDVITMNCSNVIITEWAILLVQLVVSGVIDLTSNSELFTTVLDMLAALIHSTLTSDSGSDTREENKKHYYNLVKKIKKELGEHNNVSLRLVRQLIPTPKVQVEVVVMEPWGSITDTKGNRQLDFDKDKKHGVQGSEKQKLSPWDLLEGHRSPAPLSWAWLAATRLIRKTLKYQDTHQLLRFHTHSQQKSLSYFLDPPPLPPEELEPVPEKQVLMPHHTMLKEEKAPDTPTSDHNIRGANKKGAAAAGMPGGKNPRRIKKPRLPAPMPTINQQPPTMPMGFQQSNYSAVGNGPVSTGMNQVSQWSGNYAPQHQTPQQPPPQQPQPYYQQLPPANTGVPPRYPGGPPRYAIRQTVLERQHISNPAMMGPGQTPQQQPPSFGNMGPMMNPHAGNSMIRQPMRGGTLAGRQQQAGMYPNNPAAAAAMQGAMAARQALPSQMYNTGPGGQGVNSAMAAQYAYQQGHVMGQGYQQTGYQGPAAMMSMRQAQQPPYMSQGQMVQRPPQYMQTTSGGGSNLNMMSGGQAYARPGMVGMGGVGAGGPMGAGAGAMGGGGGGGMGPGSTMGTTGTAMSGANTMGTGGGGGAMGGTGTMAGGGMGCGVPMSSASSGVSMSSNSSDSNTIMQHHRMMMTGGAATTTNTVPPTSQQSQMMMRGMAQQQQGQQSAQQQSQQPGQQANQQGQQQQGPRQNMMGTGRGYPQAPY